MDFPAEDILTEGFFQRAPTADVRSIAEDARLIAGSAGSVREREGWAEIAERAEAVLKARLAGT